MAIAVLFSSCKMAVVSSGEKRVLLYGDVVFSETDEYGRNVSAAWIIPEEKNTHKVPVYYGEKNNEKKENNTFAESYDEKNLKMFLVFAPPGESKQLYCDTSYALPDYREEAPIKAIKIYNNETTVTIDEKQAIKRFAKTLKMAANENAQLSEMSDSMKDYLLDIKYSNCGAWYSYGRLVYDINGQPSVDCYDVNGEGVYTLSEADIALLELSGLSL